MNLPTKDELAESMRNKVDALEKELAAANKRADEARAVAIADVVCKLTLENSNIWVDASSIRQISALATLPPGHVVVPVDLLDSLSSEECAEQRDLNLACKILAKARPK